MSKNKKIIHHSSLGWKFRVLGMWMNHNMSEKLIPLGLSLDQFAIIMILLKQDCLTQVEICKLAMMPAYATTRNLDKLESLDYVKRQNHESSRRSYRVLLTEKGRELAPALAGISKSVHDSLLSPLDEEQIINLQKVLTILTDKCLSS